MASLVSVGQTKVVEAFGGGRAGNWDANGAQTRARHAHAHAQLIPMRCAKLNDYSTKINFDGESKLFAKHGPSAAAMKPKGCVSTPKATATNVTLPLLNRSTAVGSTAVEWNDGRYTGVREIVLYVDDDGISSIQIEYDDHGSPIWGPVHGLKVGTKEIIKLDFPREHLEGFTYWEEDGCIRSIHFQKCRVKCGKSDDRIIEVHGNILGFYGSSDDRLKSLRAYIVEKAHPI